MEGIGRDIKELMVSDNNYSNGVTDQIIGDIQLDISKLKNVQLIGRIKGKLLDKEIQDGICDLVIQKFGKVQNGYQKLNSLISSVNIGQSGVVEYDGSVNECNQLYRLRYNKHGSTFPTGFGQLIFVIMVNGCIFKKQDKGRSGDVYIGSRIYDIKNVGGKGSVIKALNQGDMSYIQKDVDYILLRNINNGFQYKVIRKEDIMNYVNGFKKVTSGFSGGYRLNFERVK